MRLRAILALTLAGCSASVGTQPYTAAAVSQAKRAARTATLTFRVDIPPPSSGSGRSKFVSPATKSASFVLYPLSGAKAVRANVNLTAATNEHCRVLSGATTLRCGVTLKPPVGPYRLAVATFDGPLAKGVPTGRKLSLNNDLPVYVPSYGVTIFLAIYLDGIPRYVNVSTTMIGTQGYRLALDICQRFPQVFTLTAQDGYGNTIIGPGAPTASLTSRSSEVIISPVGPAQPNEFLVDANPSATPGFAILAARMRGAGAAAKHLSDATISLSTMPNAPDGCLVVGNYGIDSGASNVTIFPPKSVEPVASVTSHIDGPYAFAFDAQKRMYVENYWGNSVTEYNENSLTPIRTFPASEPLGIALDASGNLYVANSASNTVSVFPPGTTTPSYQISVQEPEGLAFDSSGNLYVASFYAPIAGSGTVSVYAPGGTTPTKTITVGDEAHGLAFDHAGNLFVVNDTSIMVFEPGATSPTYTITDTGDPKQIAIDSANNAYVANYDGTVTIYAPGQTTPSRTIATGRNTWSVLVDSTDRLYVGTTDHVLVYKPGYGTPILTIDGIIGALGLAITP